MATLGIEALKAELALVAAGVKVYASAKADGHLGVEDLGFLLTLVGPAQEAFKNLGQVVPEFKDLTAEEVAALGAAVVSDFTIGDAKIAAIVQESLATLAQVYKLIEAFKK